MVYNKHIQKGEDSYMEHRINRRTIGWIQLIGGALGVFLCLTALIFIVPYSENTFSQVFEEKTLADTLDKNANYTVLDKQVTAKGQKDMMTVVVENEETKERNSLEFQRRKSINKNEIYENFKELVVGDTFQYEGDGKIKRED